MNTCTFLAVFWGRHVHAWKSSDCVTFWFCFSLLCCVWLNYPILRLSPRMCLLLANVIISHPCRQPTQNDFTTLTFLRSRLMICCYPWNSAPLSYWQCSVEQLMKYFFCALYIKFINLLLSILNALSHTVCRHMLSLFKYLFNCLTVLISFVNAWMCGNINK